MAGMTLTLLPTLRAETKNPYSPNGGFPLPRKPALSLPKPSWVVRTESNVRRQVPVRPDPPCVVCGGRGRVECHRCYGRGRTNCVHLAKLPKGEWPKWCRTCGGSGLDYCSRCLGTGEYRHPMGFQFMRPETNETQTSRKQPSKEDGDADSTDSALDRLLKGR